MMLVGAALLADNPDPTDDDVRWAISGNICRCTGYMNIVKAIQAAAAGEGCGLRDPPTPERKEPDERRQPPKRSAASVTASAASRTTGSSAARATTSTTSTSPGCSTWRSCGARTPTRTSRASTARRAQALDGVIAVVTGELMAQHNLAWMPTLSGDTQAVLATDKVRFQGQEVAAVDRDRPLHR